MRSRFRGFPAHVIVLAGVAVAMALVGCRERRGQATGQPSYPQQQPPPGGWSAPPGGQPAGQPPPTQPTAAPLPWPFQLPPGFVLPAPPPGWAIPGFPWPAPGAATPAPGATTAPAGVPVGGLPSPDARGRELADRINAYRKSRGLPPVPLSRSLGIVAATHVRDQETNHPDVGSCNQHSWTATSQWTGCCYTADHAQAACMWKKPAELTGFRGTGYEISTKTTGTMTPADAVTSWQSSPAHHAVMINEGTWSSKAWRSMGTACGTTHAVAWFAEEADPTGGF